MLSLSGDRIRQTFLNFYADKGHAILPSASLVPEDPTVLLTIAGMLPFKPIFLGQRPAPQPRATTSQKCIRTNDIENVGRTQRHHTFFEMLGNFSFGDYFKKEAVTWAWELSTEVFQLPADRLVVSVFREDDEAFALWRDHIGIPAHRIIRMDEADNFWASGPTGPCGPCSEIYYDFHPELGDSAIDLEDDTRFIEFYNLVFMQYNRDVEGNLTPLAAQNIDTGLGLERMAQILQGKPNNYETDLIFPIIEASAKLAEIDYAQADDKTKVSLKVIGDHLRAVVHLIADGVTASNLGRGYVLRRLIRRVVRHGRLIGLDRAFTVEVAEVAIALMEQNYPNLREREAAIKGELEREEVRFLETLERGEKLLAALIGNQTQKLTEVINSIELAGQALQSLNESKLSQLIPPEQARQLAQTFGKLAQSITGSPSEENLNRDLSPEQVRQLAESISISGADAFTLYDTYGFPLELTQEIAEEAGLTVDVAAFEAEMEQQKERGRAAHETIDLTVQGSLDQLAEQVHPTEFLGYTENESAATVVALLVNGKPVETAQSGDTVQVVLDKTPFYGESGGQVGDQGWLQTDSAQIHINDVQKESGMFVHFGRVDTGTIQVQQTVTARLDRPRRRRAQANHSATHLLQAALKTIVDPAISQAGSLVDFDRLRFDFNCSRAVSPEELTQIEDQINTWIAEAHGAEVAVMPIAEAKAKGAVAMFGEKYGAEVRVVDFPGVSMELCGGTHVANTAEIGAFKIVAETGIASGIRRIEAVAGPAVLDYLKVREAVVKDLGDRFKAKPEEIPDRVTTLQEDLKAAQKQLESLKAELAIAKSDSLLSQAEAVGSFQILVAHLEGIDAKALQTAGERLQQKLGEAGAVILGSVPEPGKVSLVAAFGSQVIAQGLQAGKFIGGIAKLCGGGGGGRPNLAQAGGRDESKLPEALEAAKTQLHHQLSA